MSGLSTSERTPGDGQGAKNTDRWPAQLVAGVAATVAGVMSTAVGEFISVFSQRDSQQAELKNEQTERISTHTGKVPKLPAVIRVIGGGILAMAVGEGIGAAIGFHSDAE